ncbi:MAG: Rpn family recombination-promoting nuclease/putative transposase [Bacteroidales bacterium]|jgi:predicted transposase/invertase (TIGR01784 family)|nr:Rpn family recombination-promoting nuclease/putative transposase [Bacteroidales bacterium]
MSAKKKPGQDLVRFDWALKRLLRNKANFDVLEGFISVLTGEKLSIKNMGESESNRLYAEDKFNRVDIRAENDRNEVFIIEIQISSEVDYFHRMLYGASKAAVELVSGDDYGKIRKIYHINIVYFELGQGRDYVYHGRNDFYGIHCHDLLQLSETQKKRYLRVEAGDLFPEYYILRVDDFNNVAQDNLDQWIYYLKNNAIPEDFTAPGLAVAREKLLYGSLNEEEKEDYDHHREQRRYERSIITTSREEGREEGREEERIKLSAELEEKDKTIEEKDKTIEEKEREIAELKSRLNLV